MFGCQQVFHQGQVFSLSGQVLCREVTHRGVLRCEQDALVDHDCTQLAGVVRA